MFSQRKYFYNILYILMGMFLYLFQPSLMRAGNYTLEGKRAIFVKKFVPEVIHVNYEIYKERIKLHILKNIYLHSGALTPSSLKWIKKTALKYELDTLIVSQTDIHQLLNELMKRVDIIPVKLVLAQAIIETGWGRSSAAQKTNNYFGMTYRNQSSEGILVTSDSTTNYYLANYTSIRDCISDYIHNLNTHFAYEEFRKLRKESRELCNPLHGVVLSPGLMRYSERKGRYINKINFVISNYLRSENLIKVFDSRYIH